MGLFKKKESEKLPSLPRLPSLPSLPNLSNLDFEEKSELHELPSFPSNSFGEKFSQNTIKNAIAGHDEEIEEDFNFPKFPEKKEIISPPKQIKTQELMSNQDFERMSSKKIISQEPVFVQIDKFEESMDVFKKIKKNMEDIETLLHKTKELKQKEEEELSSWESEIQEMKSQIENIDKDIFSKI